MVHSDREFARVLFHCRHRERRSGKRQRGKDRRAGGAAASDGELPPRIKGAASASLRPEPKKRLKDDEPASAVVVALRPQDQCISRSLVSL